MLYTLNHFSVVSAIIILMLAIEGNEIAEFFLRSSYVEGLYWDLALE